jgi:hypothetical protein
MISRIHGTTIGIAFGRCITLSLAAAISVAGAGGVPQVNSLSESTLNRSGRLLIFGSNFGSNPVDGQVLIDGLDAITTTWTNTEIHAYVPEGSSLGSVPVQILTLGGSSATVMLEVTQRQADGRARWRFPTDRSSPGT